MFEALRKNIQSVQDNIRDGLQKLSSSDRTPTSPSAEPESKFTVGSDLLELYQTQWKTMHHMASENGTVAEVIDKQITKLVEEYESQHSQVAEIHSLLHHLPNIMSQLHSSLATIGNIRGLFEEVEGELLTLENLDEELIHQEKVLDMKLNLALKREKSNHNLGQYKREMNALHIIKVESFEKENEKERRKKEEELSNQFNNDMKLYQQGKMNKKTNSSQEIVNKLEDIELEQDTKLLDTFLDEIT